VTYLSPDGFFCLQILPKFNFGQGSTPDPAGGAYSAPPGPLAGGEGAGCTLPKNPASAFGLVLHPFGPLAAALRALHRPVFLWAWDGNPTAYPSCLWCDCLWLWVQTLYVSLFWQ